VPELIDHIADCVDRIEAIVDVNRPSPRFVYFDESKEHVEPVTLFSALCCAPASIDLGERRSGIFVRVTSIGNL
jgi:hypothetical protein